jgi:hypothetical protein
MKYTIDFDAKTSTIDVGANKIEENLATILKNINENAVFDSGIIPVEGTGLISYRRGFGREQFVYQMEPQKHLVLWGQSESTQNKPRYLLAEPWKIIIADFEHGNFLGLRHFYSEENIMSPKQPLLAINLPNTNTTGYGGTSIGWTCLYRNDNTTNYSFSQKISYFLERESGANEPYNNANMSSTDGPRFYQRRKAPVYIWDPLKWQEKTKSEGVDWVLKPDLFCKIRISWQNDPAATMHSDSGEIYTLGDAMYRSYYAYYPGRATQAAELPINAYKKLVDEDKEPWIDPEFLTLIGPAWRTGKATVAPKSAPVVQLSPTEMLAAIRKSSKVTDVTKNLYLSDGTLCEACNIKYPATHNFTDIITTYHFENEPTSFSEIIIDKTQPWCEPCVASRTHIPVESKKQPVKFLFSVDILKYSLLNDTFHLTEFVTTCPNCSVYIANSNLSDHIVLDVAKMDGIFGDKIAKGLLEPDDFRKYGLCCTNCQPIWPFLHVSEWINKTNDPYPSLKFGLDTQDIEACTAKFGDDGSFKHVTKYNLHVANLAEKKKGPGFHIEERFIPTHLLRAMGKAICPCEIIAPSSDACAMCLDENGEYISQVNILSKINV